MLTCQRPYLLKKHIYPNMKASHTNLRVLCLIFLLLLLPPGGMAQGVEAFDIGEPPPQQSADESSRELSSNSSESSSFDADEAPSGSRAETSATPASSYSGTKPSVVGGPPPFRLYPQAEMTRLRSALLKTTQGDILFKLFPREAPWHVRNLKYLSDSGFYRGKQFHYKKEGYIVQGGSYPGNLGRSPAYSLPPEFTDRAHRRGSLGMSRLEDEFNPGRNSHSTHFHILLRDAPHMNGNYTVFGEILSGAEVLERLQPGDRILDFKVYVKAENPS